MKALLFILAFLPLTSAALQVGFYATTCPQAESTVQSVISNRFLTDRTITAALLRMYFHDCFVNGCDASLLIAPTNSTQSEQSAGPNLTVRGFDIIDEAKSKLEAICPNTVSCSDIIALATRDAVVQSSGPNYTIPTGRRDGLRSDPNDVNLPGPSLTVSEALQFFTSKGFSLNDMVILLGGHTVGVSHCTFFRDRMENFNGTGAPDPTLDQKLLANLKQICGPAQKPLDQDSTAFLDQNTSFIVDNSYYKQLLIGRGILQIDEELAFDNSTASFVKMLASNATSFFQLFVDALVRLGNVEVLEGKAGEVRKNCSIFNAMLPSSPPVPSPTKSPSPSPSPTPSASKSPSPSLSPLPSPSKSPSPSPSPLQSPSESPSPSPSPLPSPSKSPSPLLAPSPAKSLSPSPSPTPSATKSPSPSLSPLSSPSKSPSPSPSPLKSPSKSPSPPPSPLPSPSKSPSSLPAPSPSKSSSPSPSHSPLSPPSKSPSPSSSPPSTPKSSSPSPSPFSSPSKTPSPSPLPSPSKSPSPLTSPSKSPSPSPSPSRSPSPSPLRAPSRAPSPSPSPLQAPSRSPSPSPLRAPSRSPSPSPSKAPSPSPL
ncbi:Peroxidase [Rhynchospora pubera]|uniref:peroxidase n=1 Tax=Rhynchospora pubera TaxID=906938 RepID=A0AAV8BVY4_9POAL|nr:Peroxidase [Rhynchospora pubera]